MKYVSIDIETTGLNASSNQLLEIGLVIEDTEKSNEFIEDLPVRRVLIPHKEYQINTYCMNLHRKLFEELDQVDWERLKTEGFYRHEPKTYFALPESVYEVTSAWLIKHLGDHKYVTAGKNFYGFDYKFLKPLLGSIRFHHRSLDPCTLYLHSDDKVPPDLKTCCQRAGMVIKDYHTAVGDARTVIELIRKGCK